MTFRDAVCRLVAGAVLVSSASAQADDSTAYARRWVYASVNLQVDQSANDLIALIERAGAAGYNGLMLADYKFHVLNRVTPNYFTNVKRVREAAAKSGVEIIPAIFPIGYSSGLLAHDPNLAEGLPVVAAPFVVEGREARLKPPSAPLYRNGGMEESQDDRLLGFGFQDDPGSGSFVDQEVRHSGRRSLRIEAGGGSPNARVMQMVEVQPQQAYQFSAWVKTADLKPASGFRLLILGAEEPGRALTFLEGAVQATQDWTHVDVVFNSLDQKRINAYVGVWAPEAGTVWVDDVEIKPVGLTNVLRRDGCPLVVTSADAKAIYEEGRDFEPVSDPHLGQIPWAGEYSFAHNAPPIRLTQDSRIRDGQELRVSWYHPVIIHGNQVMCCPSDPKVVELLRVEAQKVVDLFEPKTLFMSHDEIRCLNWDRSCLDRNLTPGQILARNVEECIAILDDVAPGCEIVTWSDMFDPHHNAVDGPYYLVNGTLEGSWLGLPSRISIANWNAGRARESLMFFAGRNHRQIMAGYYDGDPAGRFESWDAAAKGIEGVDGFMYTTWGHNYDEMEAYGRAMKSPTRRSIDGTP